MRVSEASFAPGSLFDNIAAAVEKIGVTQPGIVLGIAMTPWKSTEDRDAFLHAAGSTSAKVHKSLLQQFSDGLGNIGSAASAAGVDSFLSGDNPFLVSLKAGGAAAHQFAFPQSSTPPVAPVPDSVDGLKPSWFEPGKVRVTDPNDNMSIGNPMTPRGKGTINA